MKLNSFKFQDGKVFWLPEYPEEPKWHDLGPRPDTSDYEIRDEQREDYNKVIAQSLASAIEVAQEDTVHIARLIWYQFSDNPNRIWKPEKDKVYSAECEMEIKTVYEPLVSKFDLQFGKVPIGTQLSVARQIARLKLKDEIFPAANSHDMKEGLK